MPYIHLWPTPKGPIGKRDVVMCGSGAVAKQRRRHGSDSGPVNGGLVHTIEHEINVRDASRVTLEQLQQSPDGEHGPALHAGVVVINVEPALDDDDPEGGELLGLGDVGGGDPGASPGLEVAVYPPEEGGASRGRGLAVREGTAIGGGGGAVGAGEVGALDDFGGASVSGFFVEVPGREEMPRRGL